eukprot:14001564-Heterocapsa_arctica.AAC.1
MIVTDAQAELDHATTVVSELRQLIEVEAGGEQRDVEEQPIEVLRDLVKHVVRHLRLHDALH